MEPITFRAALRKHSRIVCFLLAASIALVLSQRTILKSIPPSADGQGYTIRTFALYGYLHTGQWSSFWHLLTHPYQSVFPLHYLPFLALPSMLAGAPTYILTLDLTAYFLLAAGVFKLCQALERKEWAPAVFLLCGVNNVALTDYFHFYMDMEFFALSACVTALQVVAWRSTKSRDGFISGLTLRLLFWMKPANALILLAVFILCEVFRAANELFLRKATRDQRQCLLELLLHWGYQALGFLPVLGAALFCGGAQTILQLIHNNEISNTTTPLQNEYLLRLFYFPLCLAFFYNVLLLGVLFLAAFLVGKFWKRAEEHGAGDFPGHLFIPLAVAILVWGLFFSFWVQAKGMRSLLPMLPVCWIALFWLLEKWRLRADLLFYIASAYALLAFSQKAFDLLGTTNSYVDDTYQLTSKSWTEMPSPWLPIADTNTAMCDSLTKYTPPPGIICVNSSELQKALTWRLNAQDLLLGKKPSYDVHIFFVYNGHYLNRAFIGTHMIVFKMLTASAQSVIHVESLDLIQYGIDEWVTKQHCALPGMLNSWTKEPLGYFFVFPQALTQEQVDAMNQSKPFSDWVQEDDMGEVPLEGPHFSRAEAWQLIKVWFEKRTGLTAAR
jgi:hypothetical protein